MKSKLDKYIDACNIEDHIVTLDELDDWLKEVEYSECGGIVEDVEI